MKQTIGSIQKAKNTRKLTMITAYDALFANIFQSADVDFILVGDSLNMSFAGKNDTLSATLEQMIYHTKAVCTGAPETFVICDMPFGTYRDENIALTNGIKVFQETSADAIKIEGGKEKAHIVKALTSNSIAVCGHIGLLPQNFRSEGGYKVKGKDETNIASLIEDAKAIEEAGAFMMVAEGVKEDAAKQISEAVDVPVIGIGAGSYVDGQVLVWSDMLGFLQGNYPKFVRQYINGASLVKDAVTQYKTDVESGAFPGEKEKY